MLAHALQFSMLSSVLSFGTKPSQSRSGALGRTSVRRASEWTTFTKGIFQFFNLPKIAMNPIGDPSVLPFNIRYIYDSKLQFEKLLELEVGVF